MTFFIIRNANQMFYIPYTAQNFKPHWGSLLAGSNLLTATWAELVWSAITVGKPGVGELFSHHWHSLSDVIVRSHLVYASLRQTSSRIEKSTLYDSLDPTEKGATSYFVGMMASKLVATRLLNTPWLFHVSRFKHHGGEIVLNGNSQPDLIGLNRRRDWMVIEAKGRTNGFNSAALLQAKSQTRKLRKINGEFPAVRVAAQAYFSPSLEIMLDDPEPEDFDVDAVDVVADLSALLQGYYSFAYSITRESNDIRKVHGRKYAFRHIKDLGISLGLDLQVLSSFGHPTIVEVIEKQQTNEPPSDRTDESIISFPDMLAIQLDSRWAKENMVRQPLTRNFDTNSLD